MLSQSGGRMRMIRCASVVSLFWAAAGCAGPEGRETIEIEARPLTAEEARGQSIAAVESGHHEIRVRRTIAVPDACRTLAGAVVRTGSELSLRVTARPDDRPRCVPAPSYLTYTATIQGLRAGRYNLRVIHTYTSERRASEVVLEHPIVVLERSVQVR